MKTLKLLVKTSFFNKINYFLYIDIINYVFNRRSNKVQYSDWYTGRWWVGCYICYSEEGRGQAGARPSPLLTVPNVTAHLSMYQVYISWCDTLIASGL